MKRIPIVFLCFFSWIITACANVPVPRYTATTQAHPQSPTISPKSTRVPVRSTILASTQPVTELDPTIIFVKTRVPTQTEVAIPTSYNLPAWMAQSDTPVLTALIANEIEKSQHLYFVNAKTGENFTMQIPTKVIGFFWFDNSRFGFLEANGKSMALINTLDGTVSTIILPPQAIQFIETGDEADLAALQVVRCGRDAKYCASTLVDEFYFENVTVYGSYGSAQFSKLGRYRAEIDTSLTEARILVLDSKTDTLIWQSPDGDGVSDIEYEWSPISDNLIAVVRGNLDPISEFHTKDMNLCLINVKNGELVRSYQAKFGSIDWSPNGNLILYLDPFYMYRNYGFAFQSAPCLLFLDSGQSKCMTSIPRSQIPVGFSFRTTGLYQWLSDSKSIAYIYVYQLNDPHYQISGNLCIYNLMNGSIDCPTDYLDVLKDHSIIHYDFSPDEKVVHFCYAVNSILNDYADTSQDAIIGMDGTGFSTWVGNINEDGMWGCSHEHIWRPVR